MLGDFTVTYFVRQMFCLIPRRLLEFLAGGLWEGLIREGSLAPLKAVLCRKKKQCLGRRQSNFGVVLDASNNFDQEPGHEQGIMESFGGMREFFSLR